MGAETPHQCDGRGRHQDHRHLGNAEDQGKYKEDPDGGNAGHQHDHTHQQRLDQCHPDDALGDRADGAGTQAGEGHAFIFIGNTDGNTLGADGARGAPGHHNARDDKRNNKANQSAAHAG